MSHTWRTNMNESCHTCGRFRTHTSGPYRAWRRACMITFNDQVSLHIHLRFSSYTNTSLFMYVASGLYDYVQRSGLFSYTTTFLFIYKRISFHIKIRLFLYKHTSLFLRKWMYLHIDNRNSILYYGIFGHV